MELQNKKIAIVYDWIDKWGGVERLLIILHEIFPHATFFTSSFDLNKATWAKNINIKASFIQRLPNFIKTNRILSLPFYPFAFESFNFNQFDTVISVTSSFAKAVITKPGTKHICILLTPSRFLWILPKIYLPLDFKSLFIRPFINYLMKFDLVASNRPDKIISISKNVAYRCKEYYKRDSEVIYPGFDIDYWNNIKLSIKNYQNILLTTDKKYFLAVTRLEKYKKVDLIINVFNMQKDKNLLIVGVGSEEKKLKKLAKKNTIFLGQVNDQQLAFLYSRAEALIMPQEEDFGYVALEAQFFGCPVIAYDSGGARETIIDKKTGIFFENQTVDNLARALEQFHIMSYNLKLETKKRALPNIKKFEKQKFINKIKNAVLNNF